MKSITPFPHAGGPLRSLAVAFRLAAGALLAAVAGLTPLSARADISLATKDTFSSTNEGWQIGGAGVQPTQVSSLGPDGQLGYLSHFSDGGGSNGKWLMWNTQSQWLGNYTAAGVTGIDLFANVSSGTSPVDMRLAFNGPGGWFYSDSQSVGSGWSSYSFPLTDSTFTYTSGSGGTGTFADTMAGVTDFEIMAGSAGVVLQGGKLQVGTSTNTILLDDIAAVPEPSVIALAAVGGLVGCGVMLRRQAGRRRSISDAGAA